jgi:hypothetical protein
MPATRVTYALVFLYGVKIMAFDHFRGEAEVGEQSSFNLTDLISVHVLKRVGFWIYLSYVITPPTKV